MEKGTKIKIKDLWKLVTVVEETPDEWGREGRGTPFKYLNKKYAEIEVTIN